MAQYEADKVIALLQFCCWSSRLDMNHQGLLNLREKLADHCEKINALEKTEKGAKAREIKSPNEKYLVDLLSEANMAVKKDNKLSKSKVHMELLLSLVGFDSWNGWEIYLFNANEYITSGNLDLTVFSSIEIGVSIPVILENQVLPYLSFVRKTAAYPIHLCSSSEESAGQYMAETMGLLKEYVFVIWTIPVSWNNQLNILNNPLWQEMLQSRRILPVWIDESNIWEIQTSKIPWLKNHQTIGGLRGLFCGILYMYESIKKVHDSGVNPTKGPDNAGSPKIQNFQGSRGTFFLGDIQITSANTSLGDIHQTIHNHNNTKKDDTNS